MEKGSEVRKAEYPIDELFLDRWSPRAMSGELVSETELFTLFEAARWAPSSSNIQPWHFVYVNRDSPEWDALFSVLVEFNQMWAKNAGVLVCLLAKKTDKEGKPNRTHLSDAGAAWENLSLQATKMSLVVHGIGGFDVEGAREKLQVPEDYEVVHMFTIGKPGPLESIHERMQKSEHPSDRKPITEFISKGVFKKL